MIYVSKEERNASIPGLASISSSALSFRACNLLAPVLAKDEEVEGFEGSPADEVDNEDRFFLRLRTLFRQLRPVTGS